MEIKYDKENLNFLYEYQIKQYEYVKAQTIRLDDKAIKYLTFITLVMAIVSILFKYYFFDMENYDLFSFSTVPIFILVLLFISIFCIIRWLLLSLKVTDVLKLSAGMGMQEYITTNSMEKVYEGLSDDLSKIIASYEASIKNKKKLLEKAFNETSTLGILLLVLGFSILLDFGIKHGTETTIASTCTEATR
ncbi:hypothetical protein HYG89_06320 [Acinetobacter sp. SwsAc5]|uniref:hypothetical protein n=1 Tax=Acinetobacter sp. SwsAc5 TaxID=2749438 RepID=UPI0015BF2832|nr:hypothetical protein [Acinetobacter sp. SwsAc5]NWK52175.1 hypothetical protein [Acinetobacter sp. SwsAc5]